MPHVDIAHFPTTLSREEERGLEERIVSVISEVFDVPASVVSISTRSIEAAEWNAYVAERSAGPAAKLVRPWA